MPALVLGGAGFIGSHLCDELLVTGMEVMVVDDLSTGKLDNLRRWKGSPLLDFVRADARDLGLLARACDHKGWVFSFLPFAPDLISCARASVKRIVLNGSRLPAPQPFVCEVSLDSSVVYGPRGPREGTLFVSDVVRANMMAVMNRDFAGEVSVEQLLKHSTPLVTPEQGRAVIDAYERANPTSLIVLR